MSNSRKVKKILAICLLVLAVVISASVMGFVFLFTSMKEDVRNYRQLTEQSLLTNPEIDGKAILDTEDVIENKLAKIQTITMIMCIFIIADVTLAFIFSVIMKHRTSSQMYRYAYVDEVTGLPTKAKHRQDIEKRISEMDGELAYISFEIDKFKYVNDMYGYAYGNYILKYVADGVSKELSEGELFSRTAGACFGLLLNYHDDEALRARLLTMFRKIGHLSGDAKNDTIYNIMFNCGVCRVKNKDEDAGNIREYANIARESAIKLYDNNIEFYDEKLQKKRDEQEQLEFEMRPAFEQKQFTVYFQPKYSTSGETIVGAEALIRWEHPTKGMIFPNVFIPLFEANGFIVKIDYFVLEKVCMCLRSWIDEGLEPVAISVNLSRVHLYDPDLVNKLVEITDRYQIPHNLIEFELTETVLFEELTYLFEVMASLKRAGFILSMDDFGSGYSSLNMLKKLPVDILKLDKAFLENLQDGELTSKDKTIISHIISMAKALHMEVLAEGVENENQKDFLLNTDCDMIQGYYYARPMKLEQFDAELRKMRNEESVTLAQERTSIMN